MFILIAALLVVGLGTWGYLNHGKRIEYKTLLAKCQQKRASLLEKAKAIEVAAKKFQAQASQLELDLSAEKERTASLSRFEPIADVHHAVQKLEEKRILVTGEIAEAKEQRNVEVEQGKSDAMALRQKAQQESLGILERARRSASSIEAKAHQEAEELAGSAYQATQNESKIKREIRAIENRIQGYGDEYLVPGISVLDEMAELWEHKEAGQQLKVCRKKSKDMIKHGMAALCDYSEARRQHNAIQFAIDAFNGRVDAILARARHDNYGKLRQEILDTFAIVNRNGEAFRDARITDSYLDLRMDELKWAVATFELKKQDQEEQRRIREEIREEQRVLKEIEKTRREAEKETQTLHKAMQDAEKRLAGAHADQRAQLEAEMARLQAKLAEAEARGQRAISQAQQTRRGHVYIISNVGSFGENIYKIGLTRRLEPLDRVRELGDASVPFRFDVHAMLFSEDAPGLENSFHKHFADRAVNLVNSRKEFYTVSLDDIRTIAKEFGSEAQWTMRAEAAEYRESIALREKIPSVE
jgi:hypothetical protein